MTAAPSRPRAPETLGAYLAALRRPLAGDRRPPQVVSLALTAVGLAALTALLLLFGGRTDLDNVLLLYLLAVVIVAITAGRAAALAAAVTSYLLEIYLFTPPLGEFDVFEEDHLVELTVFLLVAVLVSIVADAGTRSRLAAHRHQREAQVLSDLAAIRSGGTALEVVLSHLRGRLGLVWLRVVATDGDPQAEPLAQVGDPGAVALDLSVDAGDGLRLEGGGTSPALAGNARVLRALADTVAWAWQEQQLADELARARQRAEIDRVRSGLLAAVSHDLRTPLAGIKANASALRQAGVEWPPAVHDELLASIEESADQLTDLVTNVLAMSRLRAGGVSPHLTAVPVYEVVSRALFTIDDHDTTVEVPEDLPLVLADPALLERVVANLVTNAHQHAGGALPVVVRAEPAGAGVRLLVVDHGPGIAEERWEQVFQPFQRLDDTGTGLGLGLAIARGFSEAMGASLLPSRTPGGGLTMSVTLRAAP